MRGAVYAITDGLGVPRYVGKTRRSVDARFADHLRHSRRANPRLPLLRWLARHADEARVVELESGDWDEATLSAREVAWIAYFSGALLNCTEGGTGGDTSSGLIRSAETKRRMRHAQAVRRGACELSEVADSCATCATAAPSTLQRYYVRDWRSVIR